MSAAVPPVRGSEAGRAYLLLTSTALLWGANTIFARLAVGQVSPLLLVSLRWLLVSTVLLGLRSRAVREDWAALRGRRWMLGCMGALGFTGFNALYYSAAHFTLAVNIGIVQGAIPALVLAMAAVVDRARISWVQALGVGVSLLGVAVVVSAGDLGRLSQLAWNAGDALMVLACFLYAGYTIALRRSPTLSPMGLLCVLALAAWAASLPLALLEWLRGESQWPTLLGWLLLALIATLPSLLAQAWFIRGVQLIGPSRAGLFVNLVPVFAALLGVAVLSEPFEDFHLAALVLVLGGIWLAERERAVA